MMNDFSELYKRIEYLRNNGPKMKEIADWVGMAPSVLSSLYTTVLPAYFESAKTMPQEEALDQALSLVNNVSKRKLLSGYKKIGEIEYEKNSEKKKLFKGAHYHGGLLGDRAWSPDRCGHLAEK